jgi:adenosylcobinamide-GDP ribazoletransferase
MMENALTAAGFLSRLPLGNRMDGGYRKSVMHFPLVGFIASGVYLLVHWLCSYFLKDNFISVVFAFGAVYYYFNSLHFDGLLDSIDGLLSQKPKDEMLRIMKQGNTGPSGMFWGALYIALKIYLLFRMNSLAAVPMFVIGRWGMGFSCCIGKPARADGLGISFLGQNAAFWALSTLYLLILFVFFNPSIIAVCLMAVLLLDIGLVKVITRKIGGMTGDTIGSVNESNELAVLMILYAFSVHGMTI